MKPTIWHGCYDSSWNGIITPESFAHPAKFSRGLIERIFDYCLAKGYLKKGEKVGDPFGGIGTGGIAAAYRGLHWIGCELESRFVDFAWRNFALHTHGWAQTGKGSATIIQGDSRNFAENVAGIVTSPPYADSFRGQESGIDESKVKRPGGPSGNSQQVTEYGHTDGQIAKLSAGTIDACISSPPYAGISPEKSGPGVNIEKQFETYRASGGGMSLEKFREQQLRHAEGYGKTDGQISQLKGGCVDGVVSSPPWEDQEPSHAQNQSHSKQKLLDTPTGGRRFLDADYGQTEGQIGKESGETYWQAVSAVYSSCFQAIKPSGVIVLVVKDYVQKGKRVRLCDDTLRLLQHIGFQPLERIHAMLKVETIHNDLFEGQTKTVKERKSFFRRLAEKKGSPPIDFEEVLICRRP